MTKNISRRSLAKGALWAAPTTTVAMTAPAYAASSAGSNNNPTTPANPVQPTPQEPKFDPKNFTFNQKTQVNFTNKWSQGDLYRTAIDITSPGFSIVSLNENYAGKEVLLEKVEFTIGFPPDLSPTPKVSENWKAEWLTHNTAQWNLPTGGSWDMAQNVNVVRFSYTGETTVLTVSKNNSSQYYPGTAHNLALEYTSTGHGYSLAGGSEPEIAWDAYAIFTINGERIVAVADSRFQQYRLAGSGHKNELLINEPNKRNLNP